jgi:hypothetical protein
MKSVYIARRLNSVQRPLLLVATAMVIVAPMSAASQIVMSHAADPYGGMLHATARVPPSKWRAFGKAYPMQILGSLRCILIASRSGAFLSGL